MRVKIAQPSAKTVVTQLELVGLRGKLVGQRSLRKSTRVNIFLRFYVDGV